MDQVKYIIKHLANKMQQLRSGNIHDFSKLFKIVQYLSVVSSEYDLYMYHPKGMYYPTTEGKEYTIQQ